MRTLLLLCVSVLLALGVPTQAPGERRLDVSADAVERRLRADVEYLASDALEGRGLSTVGLVKASEYIATAYDAAGLQTRLIQGKPFFIFNTRTWKVLREDCQLRFQSPKGRVLELALGDAFQPLSIGADGEFDAELVFAGYGITDEESGYDDFANVDVKGKAAVILRREPQQDDPDSPFAGTKNSQHAYLVRKVQNAANHGATMVILCTDAFSLAKSDVPDSVLPYSVKSTLATRPVPVVHVTRKALEPLFSDASLQTLEQAIDKDLKPQSRPLAGWRVQGLAATKTEGNALRNVVGLVDVDNAEETIVVGAHYDHLGRGGSGSLAPWTRNVHNGADDNASGTSVMMEVARQVAQRKNELKRRVLFIAFSAEESGLIGSARYVRSPLIPMKQTAAMVNLDMVGRLRNEKLTVYGTGTGQSFNRLADRLGERHGFELNKIASGYGPSDHASFHGAGVPVLHLFTGLHVDYHRPSDDFDKLNYEGMQRITRMTVDIVMELASSTETTRPSKQEANATPQNKLKPGSPMLGASIKDLDDGSGCRVTRLLKGGPAEKAGLRVGDLILSWDDEALDKAAALQSQIAKQSPGDEVVLQVKREGLPLRIVVRIGKAP